MRNRKFVAKFIAISAVAIAILAFNWDRVEMENRAFVIALGVEAGEDEAFKVALSVIDPTALEEGEETPKILYEAEGKTLEKAMEQVGKEMSDTVYYGHTKAIIIGEDILSNSEKLWKAVDTLAHNNDINIRTIVMTTSQPVGEVLQTPPKNGNLLGLYLVNYYDNNPEEPKMSLETLISDLRQRTLPKVPKIAIEDDEIHITAPDAENGIGGLFLLRATVYIFGRK